MAANAQAAAPHVPVRSRFVDRFFRAGRLPSDVRQYYGERKREYRLATANAAAPVPEVVRELLAIPDRDATWSDLAVLERAYVAVMPDDEVRGQVTTWRNRLNHIIGDQDYAAYLATKPADPADPTASLAQMRADLGALIDRLNYLYTATPSKERIRNRLSFWLSVITVGTIVVTAMRLNSAMAEALTSRSGPTASHTLSLAALAGLLGAFVSVQQRLQGATEVDPLFKRLQMASGFWNIIVVAPISGLVFACVLYAIFAAGAVTGTVFPVIHTGADPRGGAAGVMDLGTFLRTAGPATGADLAKLVVWSFVAGFAERFVPDVLTRLASADIGKAKAS